MKKRILSLFLALLMVSGLAMPALADVFALVETSPDPEQKQAAEPAPPMTAQTEDGLVVEVALGEDVTNIPEGSHVDVAPLSEVESEEYEKLGAAVLNGKVAQSRFVDITILDPDGQSVEPNGKVKVSLNAPDAAPEGSTMHVVHFKDPAASAPSENEENDLNAELPVEEKTELQPEPKRGLLSKSGLRAESITLDKIADGMTGLNRGEALSEDANIPSDDPVVTDGEEQLSEEENEFIIEEITDYQVTEEGTILFETDSFSVFGIIYTVDFHWDVEGMTADYSITGGTAISLSQLISELRIVEEDQLEEFLMEIENIEFSNADLMWIGKVDEICTVGDLKEINGLECEYSEELTEEQIEEINKHTIVPGDWVLISLKPFISEETLTVTMKNEEQFVVKVTDAQISKTVIDAKGDTWEITVTYGPDAQIPVGAELEVRELDIDTPNYAVLVEAMEAELNRQDKVFSTVPALFDISIIYNGAEIEPAPNSTVLVEAKLVRGSMGSIFNEENSAVQINEEPLTEENSTVDAHLCVIHAKKDGLIELVDAEEELTITDIASSFTTDSFSDWLLYLDEDIQSMTVGVDDTITLRPYSSWIWKHDAEITPYNNASWDFSDTNIWERGAEIRNQQNAVIGYEYHLKNYVSPTPNASVQYLVYEKYDDQLKETYNVAYGYANGPGEYDLKTTLGKTIHVTVVGDVRDVPPVITNTANIAVNLFNYDNTENHVLDVSDNTANSVIDQNINVGHDLKFLGWGYSGDTNNVNAYTQEHARQGNVETTLHGGDYPYLNAGSHESLAYLFDTSANSESVKGYANVQGLFQQDANGYYYYNSNINYAWFDETKNRFVLYEHTFSQNTEGTHEQTGSSVNAKPIGFFPFHRYDAPVSDATHSGMNHNILLDHHFGMSMQVDFTIPANRLLPNGDHIIYEFSGDDDLWVFVDDNLVLDIGGIHQPVRGYIDFTTEKVYVYGVNGLKTFSCSADQKHTLRMFYLERGGCDSNLAVKFNLPLTLGDLEFTKVDVNRENTYLKGAVFGLFSDEACTHLVTTATSSDVEGNFGKVTFTDVPLGTGIYYMKEIEPPKGYIASDVIYRVTLVDKTDTTHKSTIALKDGNNWTPVTSIPNAPDYTSLTVKKNWIGDPSQIGADASIQVIIKRYKLVADQQGQGQDPQEEQKGILVIGQMLADDGAVQHPEYFKVDYIIKKGGVQVRSGSYTGTTGATITDLEPGNDYSIEAVCTSTNSEYYVGNEHQNYSNIKIVALDTATVTFSNTLTKAKQYHVRVMSKNNEYEDNYDNSWPDADYPEGTQLRLKWHKNQDGRDSQYNDGSGWKTITFDEYNDWYYDIGPLNQNVTIKLNNTYSGWNAGWNWLSIPELEIISAGTTSPQSFSNSKRLSVGLRGSATNGANNPTAPVGYRIDTTSEDVANWSKTVTLPDSDPTPWEKNLEELEKVDLDGSIYVYYIDSVTENGMPEGTEVEIDLDGNNKQVVLGDQETPGTLSLTNTLFGNLIITKTIQKNGNTDTSATGTFYYAVYREQYDSSSPQDPMRSGKIEVSENGTASITEEDLPQGSYYVYELTGERGVPITNGSGVFEGKYYTVTVNGSPAAVSNTTPTVSLTNNYETVTVDATKEWKNAHGATMIPNAGTIVTLDLYIGNKSQGKQVVLNGKTDVANEEDLSVDETIRATQEVNQAQVSANAYEQEPWKAYWGDLAKYDIGGNLIQYIVKEVNGPPGFVNSNANGVSTGGHIINQQLETEINILKVDKGQTPSPLTGAKFVLEMYDDNWGLIKSSTETEVSSEQGKEGTLKFEGLTVGKYKLKETKSPDGYIITSQPPEFEVIEEDDVLKVIFEDTSMVTYDIEDNLFTIQNEPGAELPSTGGSTRTLSIIGTTALMIAGAGYMLATHKKKDY